MIHMIVTYEEMTEVSKSINRTQTVQNNTGKTYCVYLINYSSMI